MSEDDPFKPRIEPHPEPGEITAYQDALVELLLALPPLPKEWGPDAVGSALRKALVAYNRNPNR